MKRLTVSFVSFLLEFFVIVSSFSDNNILVDQYRKASENSLLWGPYRSDLYVGIRPRVPRSLLSGLMWFNVDDYNGVSKIRHFYEQGDQMKGAGWTEYDPRSGGRQIINDNECHLSIVTDFVKSDDGNWGLKIRGIPKKGHENVKTSLVFYTGLEGEGYIKLDNDKNYLGYRSDVSLSGISEDLGIFKMEINDGPKTNRHPTGPLIDNEVDPKLTHHYTLRVPDDNIWKAKDIFMTMLKDSIAQLNEKYPNSKQIPPEQVYVLRDLQDFEGNMHYFQKTYQGKFEFDIIFNTETSHEKVTFENINDKVKNSLSSFNKKFNKSFSLQAPFDTEEYQKFAKELVSGLLGGIGYFYGDHLVDRETVFDEESFESYVLHGKSEGPFELFSAIPSRPFFPRGFYWDEGFHLLPILEYDSDLALEILKSWFSLIDDQGWIAREQILGPEARSRVPEKFQVQSPEIANPPTLMMVFSSLLERAKRQQQASFGGIDEPQVVEDYGSIELGELGRTHIQHPELLISYAKGIYPQLKLHFKWFRKSQKGLLEEFDRNTGSQEAYRWRGRTLTHCLASGLDDYPRALPADIAELNVDLISWVGVMARSMKLIAELIDETEDAATFAKIQADIEKNIESLHWSEKEKAYCDLTVDDSDEDQFVCHKGYVSLFPFVHKLIPTDSSNIKHVVELIRDPEELWSEFGIRSLSKKDEYFRTAENYWRSPIWVNINYLILESLQHYSINSSQLDSETQELIRTVYKELRVNLVTNVFEQWKKTGFFWEQYDESTGEARGAKNFLGWTSLISLIMKMPESL